MGRIRLTGRKAGSGQTKGKEVSTVSVQQSSRVGIGTSDRRGLRVV